MSEFMKTLLQRFTRWHNTRMNRRSNLWEETFKSVIVEDGLAARTMAHASFLLRSSRQRGDAGVIDLRHERSIR